MAHDFIESGKVTDLVFVVFEDSVDVGFRSGLGDGGGDAAAEDLDWVAGLGGHAIGNPTTSTSTPTTTTPARVIRTLSAPFTCDTARNHGEYVAAEPKDKRPEAAKSDCGKKHDPTTSTAARVVPPATSSTTTPSTVAQMVSTTSTSIVNHPGNSGQGGDGNNGNSGNRGKNGKG